MDVTPRHVVLALDDEAPILNLLTRSLAPRGYGVISATDLESAEATLVNGPVDAVIVDLRLARHSSGLELLAFARQHDPLAQLPILVLTGVTDMTEEEEDSIRQHGAYVFYKPVHIADIAATLDRLLSTRPH